jgi:hypothetical protein
MGQRGANINSCNSVIVSKSIWVLGSWLGITGMVRYLRGSSPILLMLHVKGRAPREEALHLQERLLLWDAQPGCPTLTWLHQGDGDRAARVALAYELPSWDADSIRALRLRRVL